MLTKEETLKKVKQEYSKDNYVIGMSNWDGYYIFNLLAKDPNHKMEINKPFTILVNSDGEIGTMNLHQKAKSEGREEEYLDSINNTYEDIDKIPKEESDWFVNELLKEFG